jgi:hypothetical protein
VGAGPEGRAGVLTYSGVSPARCPCSHAEQYCWAGTGPDEVGQLGVCIPVVVPVHPVWRAAPSSESVHLCSRPITPTNPRCCSGAEQSCIVTLAQALNMFASGGDWGGGKRCMRGSVASLQTILLAHRSPLCLFVACGIPITPLDTINCLFLLIV